MQANSAAPHAVAVERERNVKVHYEKHLSRFYSWMLGDFGELQMESQAFFSSQGIAPFNNHNAADLGAGTGLQTIPLANLGFNVVAVDFTDQLLQELQKNSKGNSRISIHCGNMRTYLDHRIGQFELITCMGDTITHLPDLQAVEELIQKMSYAVMPMGKIVISYRDLTAELKDEARFISVKSDASRILTCYLEYFKDHVHVYDLYHEQLNGAWRQTVSAYPKLRLACSTLEDFLNKYDFDINFCGPLKRMTCLVATKKFTT